MIMLTILFVFSCLCNIFNASIVNLICFIISMSLCVGFILYLKMSSILALMWILVYLGGMMVCFVYVLFMTSDKGVGSSATSAIWSMLNKSIVLICILFVLKSVSFNPWCTFSLQFSTWLSNSMLSSETYSQISGQSFFFFFISTMILLLSLLQVLSMLNLKSKFSSTHLL